MKHLYHLALACLVFLVCASPALAQVQPGYGYSPMPEWGVGGFGGFGLDQFAGGATGTNRARAATRLSNGDVVVVADIQVPGTARNLGIVKFNGTGQRVPFADASATYGHYNKEYLRFPGLDTGWSTTPIARQVYDVHDVKAYQGSFYVLLTYREEGRYRAAILRWTETGQYLGWWFVAPDEELVRPALAMDIKGGHIVVLGGRSLSLDSPTGGYWVVRMTINPDGTPVATTVATFNADERVVPADIAFERSTVLPPPGAPAYYVAYTGQSNISQSTWPCIRKVRPNNTTDTDFGINGTRCNMWGSNDTNQFRDGAVALHTHMQLIGSGTTLVQKEVMYLSVALHKQRANGIGLVRYVDGEPDTNWGGASGGLQFGGCGGGAESGCSTNPNFGDTTHVPLPGALYADTTGVYVAGRTHTPILVGNPQLPPQRRPIFMQVDGPTGQLRSLQEYIPGSNARFTALVPGDLVQGRREFVVAGFTHYQNTQALDDGPTQIVTARLRPKGDLFSDGFEN